MLESTETLPGVATAVIDCDKLARYCLNPAHPEGRHKARVFLSALGIGKDDAEWLAERIRDAVAASPAVLTRATPWGSLYRVDVEIRRGGRCARVRTGWLCSPAGTRLTTCHVIGECDEAA